MKNGNNILSENLEKLHTTILGVQRIRKNIDLDIDDVVMWCKNKIKDKNSLIYRKGKNFYVEIDNWIITVNSYSYTIITVHKLRRY